MMDMVEIVDDLGRTFSVLCECGWESEHRTKRSARDAWDWHRCNSHPEWSDES